MGYLNVKWIKSNEFFFFLLERNWSHLSPRPDS